MLLRIPKTLWTPFTTTLLARRDVETAGLILAERLATADGTVFVARELMPWPDDGYQERCIDFIRLDPLAINRLTRRARDEGLSIITIHTHPGCDDAWFSSADDRGDSRLMPGFQRQIPDVPHGSVVITGTVRVAARIFRKEGHFDPLRVVIVGDGLECPQDLAASPDERYARQRLALGEHGQRLLRSIRVGVVGLGGIGSAVAVQLLHQGVGGLVLIDGDAVETSNLSRIFGSGPDDVGLAKVDLVVRYATRHGIDVPIVAVPHHLRGEAELAYLRSCDVIISCVDRHRPRALMNRLSYEAVAPLIDLGTGFAVDATGRLTGDAGRVVIVGPTRPCLGCWGHLDPNALREEDLSNDERAKLVRDGYVSGADVPQPSVIAFNTMVAGAGVIELLRLVTGFGGMDAPPQRLSFSFSQATVRRNALAAPQTCTICGKHPRRGDATAAA